MLKTVFAVLSALYAAQAQAQHASPVLDNPEGATYVATLPDSLGYVSAVAGVDGVGVQFTVEIDGLPEDGFPFAYHLHVLPTPDGNCTLTEGHLDPFNRTSEPPCDPTTPELCEIGDLSGKHGKVEAVPFSANYLDVFASTRHDSVGFFGNRSVVFHLSNKDRFACANFVRDECASSSSLGQRNCTIDTPPTTSGGYATTGPTFPPYPGAGSKPQPGLAAGASLVLGAFVLANAFL